MNPDTIDIREFAERADTPARTTLRIFTAIDHAPDDKLTVKAPARLSADDPAVVV